MTIYFVVSSYVGRISSPSGTGQFDARSTAVYDVVSRDRTGGSCGRSEYRSSHRVVARLALHACNALIKETHDGELDDLQRNDDSRHDAR